MSPDGNWVVSIPPNTPGWLRLPTESGQTRVIDPKGIEQHGGIWFPYGRHVLIRGSTPGRSERLSGIHGRKRTDTLYACGRGRHFDFTRRETSHCCWASGGCLLHLSGRRDGKRIRADKGLKVDKRFTYVRGILLFRFIRSISRLGKEASGRQLCPQIPSASLRLTRST